MTGRRVRAKGPGAAITRKQSKELQCNPVDEAMDDVCDGEALGTVNGSEANEANEANGSFRTVGPTNEVQDEKDSPRASARNDEDARDVSRSVSPISSISELAKHQDSDDGGASPMAGPGPRTVLTKRNLSTIEVASMGDGSPSPSRRRTAATIKEEAQSQSTFADPCSVGITNVQNSMDPYVGEAG